MSALRSLPEPPHLSERGNLERSGALGLSTAHNCTLRAHRHGSYTRLEPPKRSCKRQGGGLRGAITEFSPASRRRLSRLLASVDRTQISIPLFVTLTYPDRFPEDPGVWKSHLRAFRERIMRRYGKFPAIWRLEVKARKTGSNAGKVAPHYHLLLFLDQAPAQLYDWLSRAWAEVVGSGDDRHLQAGTRVERVNTWRGARGYAAKYMGKLEQLDGLAGIGRVWGQWYGELLPIVVASAGIGVGEFFKLRRILRKFAGVRSTHKLQALGVFLDWDTTLRLLRFYGLSFGEIPPPVQPGPRAQLRATRGGARGTVAASGRLPAVGRGHSEVGGR